MESRLALSADAIATAQHTLFAESTEPQPDIRFGQAVAIAEGFVAVSDSLDPDTRTIARANRVQLFDSSTGDFVYALTSPDGLVDARFGDSIAASGDLLIVNEPAVEHDGEMAGAAHVYRGSTGELVTSLHDPTPEDPSFFGDSVDIDNGFVAVGSLTLPRSGVYQREVHVFDALTGDRVVTIDVPSPNIYYSGFGASVAIGDGVVAVGDADDGPTGAVYLFDASTGEMIDAIAGPSLSLAPRYTNQAGDVRDRFEFGSVVDIDDGLLVVGNTATNSDQLGYVYDLGTRELVSTLTAASGYAHRSRITTGSISISGDVVVVGQNTEEFDNENVSNQSDGLASTVHAIDGLVHVFHARSGELLGTLEDWSSRVDSIEQERSWFAVDVWQDRIITGFSDDDAANVDHGSAAIWQVNTAPVIVSSDSQESATIRVAENTADFLTVAAVSLGSDAALAYSIIDGEDQDLFQIDSESGQLRFLSPPDFELPSDVGEDNRYQVTIEVLDSVSGLTDSQQLTVQVRDRDETSSVGDDEIAPEVVSITRRLPTSETIRTETATFRVTFTEPVQFPSVDHFVASLGDIDSVSPSSREAGMNDYDVSIIGLSGMSGELTLSLNPANPIFDSSGNVMTNFVPLVPSETFTLDSTLSVSTTGFIRASDEGHFSADTAGEVIDVGDQLTVVADRWDNRVHVFDLQGNLVRSYYNPEFQAPGGWDFFGSAVATSGSLVVVGSPSDDSDFGNVNSDADSGVVYVYDVNVSSDQPVARISHPFPAVGNAFGSMVDISGANIVVGSDGDSSVHAFRYENGAVGPATTLQFDGGVHFP